MSSNLAVDLGQVQAALSRWFTDESRQGFFATDRQFRVIVWNRWMEIHSGHSAAQVLGRSLFDIYPDCRVTRHGRVLRQPRSRVTSPSSRTDCIGTCCRCRRRTQSLPFTEMPQSGHIGPLIQWRRDHRHGHDPRGRQRSAGQRGAAADADRGAASRPAPRRRRHCEPRTNSCRRCRTKSARR